MGRTYFDFGFVYWLGGRLFMITGSRLGLCGGTDDVLFYFLYFWHSRDLVGLWKWFKGVCAQLSMRFKTGRNACSL